MFYVENDGSFRDMTGQAHRATDGLDMGRLYSTLHGASQHPKAAPVTAIKITFEDTYDAVAVMNNNWKTDGLEPVGRIVIIAIGEEA